MKKTKSTPALLRQVKARVTLQVAGRLLWVWGSGGCVVGALIFALGAGIFGMAGLHAFAAGFIGWVIFISFLINPTADWVPLYRRACQEEGLWDELDRMIFENAGPGIFAIFEGREPKPFIRDRDPLYFVHHVLFQRGEPRKSAMVLEFILKLIRAEMASHGISEDPSIPRKRLGGLLSHLPGGPNFEDEAKSTLLPFALSNSEQTLAESFLALGRYDECIALMRKRLAGFEKNPIDPYPHAEALFVLVDALIQTHRIGEAGQFMRVARAMLDTAAEAKTVSDVGSGSAGSESLLGNIVSTCEDGATDLEPGDWPEWLGALEGAYLLFLARLTTLAGKPGAERLLERAEQLLRVKRNQEDHLLLLADIRLELSFLALQQKDCPKAETWARECLSYLDTETRYIGPRYRMAQAILAYVRLKQGSNEPVTREIEAALEGLRSEVAENHPDVATCLVWLAEFHFQGGRHDQAKRTLDEALKIRRSTFPENDSQTREIEDLIARGFRSPSS